MPWKSSDPGASNIPPGSDLTVTGWGRVTNDARTSKKAYEQYSVATRTLHKVELPMTKSGTAVDRRCNVSNRTIQFCAGGLKGIHILATFGGIMY